MSNFLNELELIIKDRQDNASEKSYTSALLTQGVDRILKKVGEEAGEVIIAAKNPDDTEFKHEVADLLFHVMVLMRSRDVSLASILEVLESRHQQK